MGLHHYLPLRLRLPLVRSALAALRTGRSVSWSEPRPTAQLTPGGLVVSGFLGEVRGVGKAAELTAAALEQANFAVQRDPLRPAVKRLLQPTAAVLPAGPGGVWLIHANAPETEIALMTHDPADWAGRYRIGYWAWETPEAPAAWARAARWLHEVWVPSRFVAEAMGAAFDRIGEPEGRSKLRVMPHPVAAPAEARARPERFGLKPGAAHALVMFDGRSAFARKNPWGAVEAWTRAFPAPGAARLLIKAVALGADPRAAARLRRLVAERGDILLLEAELSDGELWDLIASVDLVLSTHRAEGFGLVPAEAMALGKPVIATGWSAVTDFLDAEVGVPLPYRLTPVKDPTGAYRGQVWADPDLDAAAAALRELAASPERRAALGAAARRRAAVFTEPWAPDRLRALPFASLVAPDRSPSP